MNKFKNMFTEGEVPPEVAAEYKRMEEQKNMDKQREVHFEGGKEELVGNLQAGLMEPKDFVAEVLAREGGNPKRAEAAERMLKFSWLNPLDEKHMSAEDFSKGVYDSIAKVLKKEGTPVEKSEREVVREERIKRAIG